jgi:rhamnogalacturonan endolyase
MAQSQIFHSVHYSGEDLVMKFGANEAWKKVFGPIFIYLNTLTDGDDDPLLLWDNAKEQVHLFIKTAII